MQLWNRSVLYSSFGGADRGGLAGVVGISANVTGHFGAS
jgi:hypothetical protein